MTRSNFGPSAATAILLGGLGFAAPAHAQALNDHVWIEASAFWPKIDTDVSVSSTANNTVGTHLDLESDLGLDDHQILPAIFAGIRIGHHFSIGADYYSLGRDSTRTINRDIVFDDVTYPTNASITTNFDTKVYRLTLGYAFIRRPNFELGAALGLHATDFSIGLSGQGSVGGAAGTAEARRHSFLAPLPTVGLFSTWEVAPRLTLGARIDWLSLSIGDYDGRLINTQASAVYRVFRNVGIGLGYRYVDYRVDATKPRFTGRFAYAFSGPTAFLQVGF